MKKSERQKEKVDYKLLNEEGIKEPKRSLESATTEVETKTARSAHSLEVPQVGACGGRASDIEYTIFSPTHSDHGEDQEDEELKRLENEFRRVKDDERLLLQEKRKDDLRKKIKEKKDNINKLKGTSKFPTFISSSAEENVKSKSQNTIDIRDLRSDKKLRAKVEREIKRLGLIESDSDSYDSDSSDSASISDSGDVNYSTSSDSDISRNHSRRNEKRSKVKKSKKKSGISAKSSDKVKHPQKYPHSQLRYEFVSANYNYDELNINLFVAGELEIIGDSDVGRTERSGRINLLKKLMYLSTTYHWSVIRSYYAAVLREIELGHKVWSDDFSYLDTAMLSKLQQDSKFGKKSSNRSAGKSAHDSSSVENVWFCSSYQRNKCQHKASHMLVVKGKMRNAQHICATCWQKDKQKLEHPECSSACPHFTA
jgi:hypothetical protein